MHRLTLKYLFTCVWACVHTGLLAGQLICVREGEVERQGRERGEWEKERMVSMSWRMAWHREAQIAIALFNSHCLQTNHHCILQHTTHWLNQQHTHTHSLAHQTLSVYEWLPTTVKCDAACTHRHTHKHTDTHTHTHTHTHTTNTHAHAVGSKDYLQTRCHTF